MRKRGKRERNEDFLKPREAEDREKEDREKLRRRNGEGEKGRYSAMKIYQGYRENELPSL